MDYLFFDVECANCFDGTGKLCEFGYVLTDEDFNVKEKESILINPMSRFDPYVIKKMLNFTEREYNSSPKFDFFYDKIIGLITEKNRLVLGHTVGGDAKYVGADCMRYKLEPPDFDHIDIVEIYKGLNDLKDAVSLVGMCEILGVEIPKRVHSAAVDAELTMLCTKAIVKNNNTTLPELIEKYPRAKGRLENYKQEYIRRKLYKKFISNCKKKGMTELTADEKRLLNDFRRFVLPEGKKKHSFLYGKRVCISYNYECFHFQDMLKIVQLVANRGGKCVGRAAKCDIFVKYTVRCEYGSVYCQRLEQALATEKKGKRIKYIEFKELLDMLGTTEQGLKNMADIDVSVKLKGRADCNNVTQHDV